MRRDSIIPLEGKLRCGTCDLLRLRSGVTREYIRRPTEHLGVGHIRSMWIEDKC